MDAERSYPLVPLPAEQRARIRLTDPVLIEPDDHDQADEDTELLDRLWYCCLCLAWLLVLAWIVLLHLKRQLIELRQQAHYWRAMHYRAIVREVEAAEVIGRLQAEIRELERRLYGRKTETASATTPPNRVPPPTAPPRRRGQQPGGKGHGRRCHDHLPTTHEDCKLPSDECRCPTCGEPFEEIPGTADGDILEIDVRAYRRRYHRQRYRRRCTCAGQPLVVTAPPPDKLIPKGTIGISLWVMILLRKFAFFQPGFAGICGSLPARKPSPSCSIRPGPTTCPKTTSATTRRASPASIVTARTKPWLRSRPARSRWRFAGLTSAAIFWPCSPVGPSWVTGPGHGSTTLRCSTDSMTSLVNHWSGLTVFVDHPEVPMDNNEAERRERGPVVARKNFYGSGALWAGRLAAMLFSLFQTIQLWDMDVRKWLTEYLTACAKAGGKPPPDAHRYLPWNMTESERQRFRPNQNPASEPTPPCASVPPPAQSS